MKCNFLFQEGFKEGISNGRESQYQHGFDLGFTDGLKSGFSIGQLMAFKELHPNSDLPDIELACESCKSGPYFPLDETSRRNREAQQNVLNTLQSAINKTQE